MGYWEKLDEHNERVNRLDPRRAGNRGVIALFRKVREEDILHLLREAPFFEPDLARRLRVKEHKLAPVLRQMEKEGKVTMWWTGGLTVITSHAERARRRVWGIPSKRDHHVPS
jgi:hypothetical protein